MGISWEPGPDCLWVVSENPEEGLFDRRAFYPWDSAHFSELHSGAAWLSDALAHLTAIVSEGEA